MKISDVPASKPELDGDYRSYKIQFQAPASVGLFTWKIYLVSDTFVGDEITRDVAVRYIFCYLTFVYLTCSAAQNRRCYRTEC